MSEVVNFRFVMAKECGCGCETFDEDGVGMVQRKLEELLEHARRRNDHEAERMLGGLLRSVHLCKQCFWSEALEGTDLCKFCTGRIKEMEKDA